MELDFKPTRQRYGNFNWEAPPKPVEMPWWGPILRKFGSCSVEALTQHPQHVDQVPDQNPETLLRYFYLPYFNMWFQQLDYAHSIFNGLAWDLELRTARGPELITFYNEQVPAVFDTKVLKKGHKRYFDPLKEQWLFYQNQLIARRRLSGIWYANPIYIIHPNKKLKEPDQWVIKRNSV